LVYASVGEVLTIRRSLWHSSSG